MKQKKFWMLLLGIGTLSSLFLSCHTIVDRSELVEYRYVNNTNYPILITNYEDHVQEVNLIVKQDSLVQQSSIGVGGRTLGDVIFFSDSVDILFDNSRILKVRHRNSDSLLVSKYVFDGNRYDQYRRNGVSVKIYKFTDADYQRASDCDGNCGEL